MTRRSPKPAQPVRSRDVTAGDAETREHTVAEFDVVRNRSEVGSLNLYPLLLKDSGQRIPVIRFHLGLRAIVERLVRSDHSARGPLDFLHRLVSRYHDRCDGSELLPRRVAASSDAKLLAPAPVVQQHDSPPVRERGLVSCRHRHSASIGVVIVLFGDVTNVNNRETAATRSSSQPAHVAAASKLMSAQSHLGSGVIPERWPSPLQSR